jgi:hypothetical protein
MSVAALAIRECGLRGELTSEARKEGRMPLQTKDRAPLAKPTMACHMPSKGALVSDTGESFSLIGARFHDLSNPFQRIQPGGSRC